MTLPRPYLLCLSLVFLLLPSCDEPSATSDTDDSSTIDTDCTPPDPALISCDKAHSFDGCNAGFYCKNGEIHGNWYDHVWCDEEKQTDMFITHMCNYECPFGCIEEGIIDDKLYKTGAELVLNVCAPAPDGGMIHASATL